MKRLFVLVLAMLTLFTLSACKSREVSKILQNIKEQSVQIVEKVATEVNETKNGKEVIEQKENEELYDEIAEIQTETVEKVEGETKEQETGKIETLETIEEKPTQKVLIATSSTNFASSNYNRKNNIELAANYIDGIVLEPGAEFSFNNVVGRRTKERGFLEAGIFSGNKVAQGVGGGICQTSTTLCIAVKQTSMKILEQNPHSRRVEYAKYEDEAMINYGTSDFRFVNTYDVPVTIEFLFEENYDRETIICSIYKLE